MERVQSGACEKESHDEVLLARGEERQHRSAVRASSETEIEETASALKRAT